MSEMNSPTIRFAGFTDDWEERKLGEIAIEVTRKAEEGSVAPVMMISAASGFIDQSTKYSSDNAGSSLKNYTLLIEGELAYNHGYSKLRNFGSCFDLKVAEARIPFVYHAFSMPNDNPSFFAYYLNSGMFDGELKKRVSSSARMDGLLNISYAEYMSLKISRPNIAEQQKISELISKVDRIITLHQREHDKTVNIKKALLEKMFPKDGEDKPEIRFSGFTDAWEQRKLSEVANIFDGTHQTPKYTPSGVMFLSVEDINTLQSDKYISKEAFESEFKIAPQKGDVLMTRIGDIGTVNIVRSETEIAYYVSLALLKPIDIDSEYFATAIASPFVQKELWTRTLHTAYPMKINKNEIEKVAIKVPNIEEQHQIGIFFANFDRLIALHQRELTKLQNIKKALLEKMFV